MRVRSGIAVCCTFLLFAALAFVAVTLPGRQSGPGTPVQQTGTAAGRSHRVSAAADVGRVADGHFVSGDSAASKRLPGPVAEEDGDVARVPGAVPAASRPKALKFPVQGKTSETVRVRPAPTVRKVAGYN